MPSSTNDIRTIDHLIQSTLSNTQKTQFMHRSLESNVPSLCKERTCQIITQDPKSIDQTHHYLQQIPQMPSRTPSLDSPGSRPIQSWRFPNSSWRSAPRYNNGCPKFAAWCLEALQEVVSISPHLSGTTLKLCQLTSPWYAPSLLLRERSRHCMGAHQRGELSRADSFCFE